MKQYTLQIDITEGNDEFWESFKDRSGCDEVVDEIKSVLSTAGFVEPECFVRLIRFEER